jgi:hypothetical protein
MTKKHLQEVKTLRLAHFKPILSGLLRSTSLESCGMWMWMCAVVSRFSVLPFQTDRRLGLVASVVLDAADRQQLFDLVPLVSFERQLQPLLPAGHGCVRVECRLWPRTLFVVRYLHSKSLPHLATCVPGSLTFEVNLYLSFFLSFFLV